MMLVPLTNSDKFAIVDDGWEEDVLGHSWWLNKSRGNVQTRMQVGRGEYQKFYLHQLIMGIKPGFLIDHINGNQLDNRTTNLRHVNCSQSTINRRRPKNNTSGCTGVVRHRSKWRATIRKNHSNTHVGIFATFEEACAARKTAEQRLHGEYARRETHDYPDFGSQ